MHVVRFHNDCVVVLSLVLCLLIHEKLLRPVWSFALFRFFISEIKFLQPVFEVSKSSRKRAIRLLSSNEVDHLI